MKLSIVIPVLNEAESLQTLYAEIMENLPQTDYEIIFVDDGSSDESFSIMQKLAVADSSVKVIRFRKNFGKAAGLQTGFENCEGDIIITMDADLQDDPREIPNFIAKIEAGYDLVTGWKQDRKDPLNKTLPSKFANSVMSKSFQLKLHDYNCGFKAFRRELIQEIDVYGEMHRYIPALAQAKGFRICEIPVHHRKRSYGKSKYGAERFFRSFLDLLSVKLVTAYTHSPLYLFGRIGFGFSLAGFIIGIYLTIMKYGYDQPLSNRPLLFLAILLIMVGIQIFSIGLLAELIVNQTRYLNKKYTVSIREKLNLEKKRGK
ncbi:MAG: glycosyltransferase [Candidatus Cloacimonadales bacterium]